MMHLTHAQEDVLMRDLCVSDRDKFVLLDGQRDHATAEQLIALKLGKMITVHGNQHLRLNREGLELRWNLLELTCKTPNALPLC